MVVADYFAARAKEYVRAFGGVDYAVSRLCFGPLGSFYHLGRAALLDKTPYTKLVKARLADEVSR